MALQKFTQKVLSFVGKEEQAPQQSGIWKKVAIIAGSIGAVIIVSLLPISVTKKKDITINKSSTKVYEYITQQTDPGLFWVGIHPKISSAIVTEQRKKKVTLQVFQEIAGFPTKFYLNIKTNSKSKSIILDANVPIFYGAKLNAKLKIVDINNKSKRKCKYEEVINMKLPILYYILGTNIWNAQIPTIMKNEMEKNVP
eukprot:193673_1